jgi:hypothetical protein
VLPLNDGKEAILWSIPHLWKMRDTDGDGKADERRDLVTGLGLTPEENPVRLHCANGLVMGHDGWLYLALGDHGCDVKRPEGDRLVFEGGGILRCRPDGSDLHVFAKGLRNIYDVALDDELNVFVRDNENDGAITRSASATASSARITAIHTSIMSTRKKLSRRWLISDWGRLREESAIGRRSFPPSIAATSSSANGAARWCAIVRCVQEAASDGWRKSNSRRGPRTTRTASNPPTSSSSATAR